MNPKESEYINLRHQELLRFVEKESCKTYEQTLLLTLNMPNRHKKKIKKLVFKRILTDLRLVKRAIWREKKAERKAERERKAAESRADRERKKAERRADRGCPPK